MQTSLHNLHDMHFLTGRHAPPARSQGSARSIDDKSRSHRAEPSWSSTTSDPLWWASSAISMSLKQRQVLRRSSLQSSRTVFSDSLPQRNHVTRLKNEDRVRQGCTIVDHRDLLMWVVRLKSADKRSPSCLFDLVSTACTCRCRSLRVTWTASVQGNAR
jgi:hypothetical protein